MDKIIDIHSHVLPGVDDGSKTIDQALESIDYLISIGVTDIMLTSHYVIDSDYTSSVKDREKILAKLMRKTADRKVNLYLGNEVFLCDSIIDLLDKKEITTLNKSRYLMIELPLYQSFHHLDQIVCELNDKKIVPIIAHPERYRFFQKNPKYIKEILEYDCLIQCNIGSLVGQYGRKAKKLMKWLLKEKLVSFVSTDLHSTNQSEFYNKGFKKLKKKETEDYYKLLTYTNAKKVLEDKEINLKDNFIKLAKNK